LDIDHPDLKKEEFGPIPKKFLETTSMTRMVL
jgi:hypothetical protein